MKKVNLYLINIFFFLWMFTTTTETYAHGDLHERIQKLTKEIQAKPDSAYLYFKRGVLYFQHEEFNKSLTDLDHASNLDYSDVQLDLHFAKVYQKLQEYNEALQHVDKILADDQHHVNAWKLKGEICFEMQKYDLAADAFMAVIEYSTETFPANYFDASLCYQLQNTLEASEQAIKVIEEGINTIGPLFTFYEKLVELHVNNKNYKQALSAQNEIIRMSKRLEKPLYNRASIYLLIQDIPNAILDLESSRQAVQKLPLRIQKHSAIKYLLTEIELKLSELKG